MMPILPIYNPRIHTQAVISEVQRRIESYSDKDLIKVYENCKIARERLSTQQKELYGFFMDPTILPIDLWEGFAAIWELRERNGREYTEGLTGIAETGIKGFLNGILNTSFRKYAKRTVESYEERRLQDSLRKMNTETVESYKSLFFK